MHKQLNLKPEFVERMKKLLEPEDFEVYKKSLEEKPLISIRCNTLKISPESLKKRLEIKGWKISQPWKNYPEVFIVDGKFVTQEEADETEKRLMDRGIGINIRKDFYDKIADKNKVINNESSKLSEPDDGLGCEKGQILINLEPGELGR